MFENYTNEQLEERLEELRDIGENPGERTAEELEQLAEEREALDTELEKRQANAARARLQRQNVANGTARNLRRVAEMGQPEQTESAEARAREFLQTKRNTIACGEVRSLLVSGGTIATPTGVSGINDMPGNRISSILDLVSVVDCNGMGSNKVAYLAADAEDAGVQTEGSAVGNKEATFGYVTITPTSIGCYAQISKQTKKQSPLAYQAKVNQQALLSLRKKAVGLIVSKIQASSLVDTVAADVASEKGKIDAGTLRKIVLAYGGDEDVVGNAVLFLNKSDLIAFGDIRGTNEKEAVFEIIPDGGNPNMGIIKDGGMSVRYCICSGMTACDGTSQSTASIRTMAYGDPKCFELDLFSDYEVRVSEDFAFTSLMDTIVGDAELGGDVVVNKGFVMLQIPSNP